MRSSKTDKQEFTSNVYTQICPQQANKHQMSTKIITLRYPSKVVIGLHRVGLKKPGPNNLRIKQVIFLIVFVKIQVNLFILKEVCFFVQKK